MSKCICEGNLRLIVEECSELLDKWFVDDKGIKHTFTGILIASDDYYYVMSRHGDGKHLYLSCVGSLETHGYKLYT